MKKEKEIGIPKNAPQKVKEMDEKMDKAKGVKEGSKADLKSDKKTMDDYRKEKTVKAGGKKYKVY